MTGIPATRPSADIIREGGEEAGVEPAFDISAFPPVQAVLEEAGIEQSGELVIKRVVQRAGRNRIYINGSLATLVTLTEVGRRLIDIYSQSEHQSLTRPDEHIEVLDSFGGFSALRARMSKAWRDYASARKEYDAVSAASKDIAGRKDLISFQLEELEAAAPMAGEDEALKKDAERLKNAGRIKAAVYGAESEIYSDAGSITERLGALARSLREVSAFDERLAKTAEAIETSLFQLEDAGTFLRDYSGSIEDDPDELERIGARLDLLSTLKKKYGPALGDVIERKAALAKELEGLSTLDEQLSVLDKRLSESRAAAENAALELRAGRHKASAALKEKIEKGLGTLGMKDALFDVVVEDENLPDGTPRLGEKGADRVSFLIAPNPGEGIKPLARIASGGELSRIMLAMKSVSAVGRVPTLVFDEIDTGVGGAMAQVVGLKLKEVSTAHQVL